MPHMSEELLKDTIRTFVGHLSVDITSIEVVPTTAHPLYTIYTNDSKQLIGPQGEHVRALNTVIKRMLEKQLGEEMPHFLIDVNGYHKKQIDELVQKATLLAERVRAFRSHVEMSPMNAYERMIVHATLAHDPEIETTSEGEGTFRHVVIRYKNKETTPTDRV